MVRVFQKKPQKILLTVEISNKSSIIGSAGHPLEEEALICTVTTSYLTACTTIMERIVCFYLDDDSAQLRKKQWFVFWKRQNGTATLAQAALAVIDQTRH